MNHPVKYWSYLEAYAQERGELLAAVDRVFSSGRLILGEAVAGFERRFSAYCDTTHGVGVNSGTDALFLALKAFDIGPGDEVVTVSNTAVPTVAAIRATGARPVFVDIDPDTFLMDSARIAERITPRTRCLLPVHLYGQLVQMQPLLELAQAKGLYVLEDCAQSTGASQDGRKAGAFGDCAAFSFYPTKLLGGFGDGGMVLTAALERADRLRRLRFYGMSRNYYSDEEGFNSRLDEVQAALLDFRLTSLDAKIARRRAIAAQYDHGLAGVGDLRIPAIGRGNLHAYYVYTIRTARRDALKEHLTHHGIGSQLNYPTPIHLMAGYAFLGLQAGDLPVTERINAEMLSLPLYPELTDEDVETVVACIRAFYAGG